jgi:tetratricopeptide (TPR) repeat protein
MVAAGVSSIASAQVHQDAAHAAVSSETLGELSFENSGRESAQAPFIRGVKLLHNFQYEQAIEAFRAAQAADPDFALAYWGEAMSHNYTLWSEQHLGEARKALAKLAPTPEARAAKAKTAREGAWLAAVEALYGPGTKFERDVAYADKMDALSKAYPNDVEAQAFAALATLGRSHGTRDVKNYEKAGAMLEPLFLRYPKHPGVAHYLIHSYDDPAHAAKGLAAARVYDRLAPDSPHAQHMTSHIFLSLGLWQEVERANLRARQAVERRAGKSVPLMACGHGGIWLVYARLQANKPVGDNIAECATAAAAAIAAGEGIAAVGGVEDPSAAHADMRVRQGLETGQWVTPLSLPEGKLNYARFIYAYGDVLAARHDPARSARALRAMRAPHEVLTTDNRKENPDDDQVMPWADLILAQAEAVGMLASGRQADGVAALQAAARRESALPAIFGPPIVQKPSWELLGDELLAAGDKAGAEVAYKESLRLQPGRRLSVAGLAKARQ